MANYVTNLKGADATFNSMMNNGFGIVTVMNALVFPAQTSDYYSGKTAHDIVATFTKDHADLICKLDTLKIANVTQEGPTKTVSGGQFSNPLIKFGKSARLEMQDALGNSKAIEALCGGFQEWSDAGKANLVGLHFGEDFAGPKMIIGESFFIDRKTGKQVKVKIVFYQFLPDSIFNLTQDAEGDATVFDMNGDLLTTVILVGDDGSKNQEHGVFYSIVEETPTTSVPYTVAADGKITLGTGIAAATLDGDTVTSGTTAVALGTAGLLKLYSDADKTKLVGEYIISR
jgi:hypothetical protein